MENIKSHNDSDDNKSMTIMTSDDTPYDVVAHNSTCCIPPLKHEPNDSYMAESSCCPEIVFCVVLYSAKCAVLWFYYK